MTRVSCGYIVFILHICKSFNNVEYLSSVLLQYILTFWNLIMTVLPLTLLSVDISFLSIIYNTLKVLYGSLETPSTIMLS